MKRTRLNADVGVIGAGIIGLSVAIEAASHGASVALIDKRFSGAASIASAGLLAPSLPGLPARLQTFAIAARDEYPHLVNALRDTTNLDVPLNRLGMLELLPSREAMEIRLAESPTAEPLNLKDLVLLEPSVGRESSGIYSALRHPLDGAVDNVVLMRALDAAAESEKRINRVRSRAIRVGSEADSIEVVLEDGQSASVGQLVIAAGAWANLLVGVPTPLALEPLNGELILLEGAPIRHAIYSDGHYLVPRGLTTLVGATSNNTGLFPSTSEDALEQLVAAAETLCPALKNAAIISHWAGIRPMSPDGAPIVFSDRAQPRIHYACGFSRNGILLGPLAGRLLATHILGLMHNPPDSTHWDNLQSYVL